MEQQVKDKTELYNIKKRTLDLLPDSENNKAKLQVIIAFSCTCSVHHMLVYV